jgi:uncharacterized protein (TIGR03437 family)
MSAIGKYEGASYTNASVGFFVVVQSTGTAAALRIDDATAPAAFGAVRDSLPSGPAKMMLEVVAGAFLGTNPTPVSIYTVANAEGEVTTIAPNTWVEIKGSDLAPFFDTRIWKDSDFVNNQMPSKLDGVSVTVNGKSAYVYYTSPTQVNILTPPDAISGPVQVVGKNGAVSAVFTAQAQPVSPSFFVFKGGPYVVGEHASGSLLGPTSLYPGLTTSAKPGETVVLFANGFGPTSVPIQSSSTSQSETLSPLPVISSRG